MPNPTVHVMNQMTILITPGMQCNPQATKITSRAQEMILLVRHPTCVQHSQYYQYI